MTVAFSARRVWETIGLLGVATLSGVLELFHLNQVGYGNTFYAAAVLSMTQSLHAFLFNSLDPAGFVSIDKPPLGFWIQVLSARLLGFSGLSILLPEALATVGSVLVMYLLVRRAFGPLAGLLAGLMLALTPVTITTGRNNTIDSLLVLVLLLSAWSVSLATERGSLRFLLLTGVLVGLGFEIKFMEAYLAVPALGLVYLLAAPRGWLTRIGHLLLAAGSMLVVSFAWPVAVDLTPPPLRPWVDSTQNNSAVSLALGYDGFQRLFGANRSLAQFISGLVQAAHGGTAPDGAGVRGAFGTGPASPLRLLSSQLGGQASWLLPLSVLGLVLGAWLVWQYRRTLPTHRAAQSAILWGTWLITTFTFFSIASRFQAYYLVTFAPAVVALAAIGVALGTRALANGELIGWLLPAAAVATMAVELHLVQVNASWAGVLGPIVLVGALLSVVFLALTYLMHHQASVRGLATAAICSLLVAPGVWGAAASVSGGARPVAQPVADPSALIGAQSGPAGGRRIAFAVGGGAAGNQAQTALVSFLEQHQAGATYLAATTNSSAAAPLILASDQPVMSVGGFTGSDPILNAQQFAQLVSAGTVRYFIEGGGGFGRRDSSGISAWVQTNCQEVPSGELGVGGGIGSGQAQSQVYDCAPSAGS